jgi:hypothetical protein
MPSRSPTHSLVNLLLLLPLLATLAACTAPVTRRAPLDTQLVRQEQAKQRDIAVAYSTRQYERLYRVGYPLLKAAAPMCEGRHRPGFGYLLISRFDFSKEMRPAASRVFKVDDSLRVHQLLPGGPAERAGMQVGDQLLKLDNFRVRRQAGEEQRLNKYLKQGSPSAPRHFTVSRAGRLVSLTVQPDVVCDYGLGVVNADAVNALADGDNVIVTKAMMRFTETDQELSLVVAHELAHNTMQHVQAKRTNAAGGFIIDVLAAAAGVNTQGLFQNIAGNAYSREFEAEADHVGLYIMARAGLPIEGAANFWRRMAAEYPASIATNHAASHPASAERFVAMEHTVQEIEAKEAHHQVLLPDHKPPQ